MRCSSAIFEKSAVESIKSIGLPPLLERVWSLADILVDGDGYSAELKARCTAPSRR